MKHPILKFALTGAHGTGKTTLATALVRKLQASRVVVQTPEVPRLIIKEVEDPHFFRRGNNTFERQCLILARQLEVEYEAVQSGADIVICDRTILDHWAYTVVLFRESAAHPDSKMWEQLIFRWLHTYSAIVHLPREFVPIDDGVREGDTHYQASIEETMLGLYNEAKVDLLKASGSVEDRVAECVKFIEQLSTQ